MGEHDEPREGTPRAGSRLFKIGTLALSVSCLGVLMAAAQGVVGCGADPSPTASPEVAIPAPSAAAAPADTVPASPRATSTTASATGAPPAAAQVDPPAPSIETGTYFPASKAGPPMLHRAPQPLQAPQTPQANPPPNQP
jgi:hypothetical protein